MGSKEWERQREEENVDEYKQTTMCCWHGNNPGWVNEHGNVAKWPQEPAELLLLSSCSHSCSHCTHVCGHRVMCVFCLLLPGHRTCQTVACSKPPSNLPHCLPVWPAPLLLLSIPPAHWQYSFVSSHATNSVLTKTWKEGRAEIWSRQERLRKIVESVHALR